MEKDTAKLGTRRAEIAKTARGALDGATVRAGPPVTGVEVTEGRRNGAQRHEEDSQVEHCRYTGITRLSEK